MKSVEMFPKPHKNNKTMKKVTKSTAKKTTVKPSAIIDYTHDYNDPESFCAEAYASYLTNSMTKKDKEMLDKLAYCIVKASQKSAIEQMFDKNNCILFEGGKLKSLEAVKVEEPLKKPNIFKRIWNKLFKK